MRAACDSGLFLTDCDEEPQRDLERDLKRDLERDLEPDPSGVEAQLQSAEAENATLRRELATLRREKLVGEQAARQREQQASAQLGAMGDKLEALATMALALGGKANTAVPVAASDVPRGVLAAATTPDSGKGGTDSGQGGQGGTLGSVGDSESGSQGGSKDGTEGGPGVQGRGMTRRLEEALAQGRSCTATNEQRLEQALMRSLLRAPSEPHDQVRQCRRWPPARPPCPCAPCHVLRGCHKGMHLSQALLRGRPAMSMVAHLTSRLRAHALRSQWHDNDIVISSPRSRVR